MDLPGLGRHRLRRRFCSDETLARRARSVRRASAAEEREPRPVVLRPAVGGRLPALRAAGARRFPLRREGAGLRDRRGDPRPARRTVGTEPDLPRRGSRHPGIRAAMRRRARPESRRARVPVLATARPVARAAGRTDRPARRVLRGAAAAAAGSRLHPLRDRDSRREPAHAALHPRARRARRALLRRPARADARPAAPGGRARAARRRRAGPADRALEPARRLQV